jgi:hypothetical protein
MGCLGEGNDDPAVHWEANIEKAVALIVAPRFTKGILHLNVAKNPQCMCFELFGGVV